MSRSAALAALGALGLLLTGCPAPWPPLVVEPRQARETPPGPVMFQNVRVFDSREGRTIGPTSVLIHAGQVRQLGPGLPVTAGMEVVDGEGKTLLPGLIDTHVHLGGAQGEAIWAPVLPDPAAQAAAMLYAGVTTAVVGSHNEQAQSLARAIASGRIPGPRLFRASRMFTPVGGHPGPFLEMFAGWMAALLPRDHREVSSAASVRQQLQEELEETAPDFIKVASDSCTGEKLEREVLAAIVQEAHRRRLPVLVHPGTPEDAMGALEAGADLLMHPPFCGELTGAQQAALALHRLPVVSTVRVFSVLSRQFQGPLELSGFERRLMRPGAAEAFQAKGELARYPKVPRDFVEETARRNELAGKNVRALVDQGSLILAGSDSGLPGMIHGAALHEELSALVKLGVPPAAALRMATFTPGRWLAPDGKLGVVEVGAWADLVLVEGDPAQDIEATRRIAGVWQRGRPIPRASDPGR